MYSVTSIPFILCAGRRGGLRRRKRADGHAHAPHGQDLDVLTASDRRSRGGRKRLYGPVVRQRDRPPCTLADADDDTCAPANELTERGRLPTFGTAEQGEDGEGDGRPTRAEQKRDERPSDRPESERHGAE